MGKYVTVGKDLGLNSTYVWNGSSLSSEAIAALNRGYGRLYFTYCAGSRTSLRPHLLAELYVLS